MFSKFFEIYKKEQTGQIESRRTEFDKLLIKFRKWSDATPREVRGLLLLDFNNTIYDIDKEEVFEDVKFILPFLYAEGVDIVAITNLQWNERKTAILDEAFGSDRPFLQVPNDIYDPAKQIQLDSHRQFEEGGRIASAVNAIRDSRQMPAEKTMYITYEDQHVATKFGIESHVRAEQQSDPDFMVNLAKDIEEKFNISIPGIYQQTPK